MATTTSTSPYAAGRRVFDADSHVMETLEMLEPHADDELRTVLRAWDGGGGPNGMMSKAKEAFAERQQSDEARTKAEETLLTDKLWHGIGAFDSSERTRALDLLGFDAQLVFGTLNLFLAMGDPARMGRDVQLSRARTFNSSMAEFCSADKRLLGVANVPLIDPAEALAMAKESVEAGCRAVMFSTVPPVKGPSCTSAEYDPFWSFLEEAEVPALLNVGINLGPNGGFDFVQPGMRENGMELVGVGDAEGQKIDHLGYITMGTGPSLCLGSMAIEGVFERHPNLKVACVEQGASWVPSWLQTIDLAAPIARRVHPTAPKLSLKPSEYIRRQVKFTPFAGENIGWLIETGGEELFLFASDYPHVEGSNDPIGIFEATMSTTSERAKDRFYCDNFLELFPSLA